MSTFFRVVRHEETVDQISDTRSITYPAWFELVLVDREVPENTQSIGHYGSHAQAIEGREAWVKAMGWE